MKGKKALTAPADSGGSTSRCSCSHSNSNHSSTESHNSETALPVMRVFVAYGHNRQSFDIETEEKVQDVRERVREAFEIGPDEGPAGVEMQEKKILTLTYAGAARSSNCYR